MNDPRLDRPKPLVLLLILVIVLLVVLLVASNSDAVCHAGSMWGDGCDFIALR